MTRYDPVKIDQMLASMTDEERERLREGMKPGRLDQIVAATNDAKRLAVETIPRKRGGDPIGFLQYDEIPGWLRLSFVDLMCAWDEGKVSTCIHQPDPRTLAPVFAAAWKPNLVVCSRCLHLLTVSDPVVDNTCDQCGHLCEGMPEDGIRPVALTFGSMIYRYGLCSDCDKDSPRGVPT